MKWSERARHWVRPLVFLGENGLTLTGAILTTSSGLTMVGFWLLELLQLRPVHPYAGIVLFLVLPGFFVAGLLLMPLGSCGGGGSCVGPVSCPRPTRGSTSTGP